MITPDQHHEPNPYRFLEHWPTGCVRAFIRRQVPHAFTRPEPTTEVASDHE